MQLHDRVDLRHLRWAHDLLMRQSREMDQTPFVDAHVHLWDLSRISYPWLSAPFSDDGPNGSVEAIARTYRIEDYRKDSCALNVVGIVHVDAGAAAVEAVEETRWLQAVADEWGMPQGIVAFASLEAPDLEEVLAAHAAYRNVRGIRQIINWHPDPRRTYTDRDLTLDKRWHQGFKALAKYRYSFDLQCYPRQFAQVAEVIGACPDVPVILNHCGMPVDGLGEWRAQIGCLARLPNVSVKLSGLGFIDREWTIDGTLPFAMEIIDLFGPQRVLFASDFPTDKLFSSFQQIAALFTALGERFAQDEKRAMFGLNADRVYRLGLAKLLRTEKDSS